jgi:hypothetical protein
MLRTCKRVVWMLVWLMIASALWALNVEATYEHNVRHGIPADFQLQNPHRAAQWRI